MRTKKNGTNTKKMCAKLAWTDKKNRNRKIMDAQEMTDLTGKQKRSKIVLFP